MLVFSCTCASSCLTVMLLGGGSVCKAGWAGRAASRVPAAHPDEMCGCSVAVVLSEDFGRERTWEVICLPCVTETQAVIPFELRHELYKVERPQNHFFFFIQANRIFSPSFLTAIFLISLAVGSRPQVQSQISRTPFTSVEGCQVT